MSEGEHIKRVVIVRHAKSSWANAGLADFDRPLNDRGNHDAPMIGKRLKALGVQPELIISSTAKRARQTAKKISSELGYKKEDILLLDKLYHCHPDTFEEVIYGIEDSVKTVIIVAHNPGITLFVNSLSYQFSSANIPTCGVVVAEFTAKNWNEFNRVEKQVVIFEYPKKQS
ncbi:MAG: histidine phosphatase family protein [Flavipsychrobacter sp.]